MILTVAILLGLAMVLNILQNNGNYNVLMGSALVIVLWDLCFPLAVTVLVLLVIIFLIHVLKQTV